MRILTVVAILAAALPSARGAYSVKRWEFVLADSAAVKSIAADKKEHHCILYNDDTKVSVVGTYGNFGYFEGNFVAGTNQALVTWWETTASDTDMTPATGGASLIYEFSNTTKVTGGFNTVVPSSYDSYLPWSAINGQLKEDSSTAVELTATNFQKYCLLTKSEKMKWEDVMGTVKAGDYFSTAPTATKDMKALHQSVWKSGQGQNQFCVDQYNLETTYSYVYSKAEAAEPNSKVKEGDKEEGVYDDSAIKYSSSHGEGMVGIWLANSGPNKGNTGTNMYKVAFKANGDPQLIGWYCNAGDKNMRDACYEEQYDFSSSPGTCEVSAAPLMLPTSTASMILATVMSLCLASFSLA